MKTSMSAIEVKYVVIAIITVVFISVFLLISSLNQSSDRFSESPIERILDTNKIAGNGEVAAVLSGGSDSYTHANVADENRNKVDKLANMTAFDVAELDRILTNYFDKLDSADSRLSKDELRLFEQRLILTVESSPEAVDLLLARLTVAAQQGSIKETRLLEKVMAGRIEGAMRVAAAYKDAVIENGYEGNDLAFEATSRLSSLLNKNDLQDLLSASTDHLNKYSSTDKSLGAIKFIGKIGSEMSGEISQSESKRLKDLLARTKTANPDRDTQYHANRALYAITDREESEALAKEHLLEAQDEPTRLAILHSIASGNIAVSEDLRNSLAYALEAPDVSNVEKLIFGRIEVSE